MKISRLKRVNRRLAFFCRHFGFHKPFQVLLDATFCQAALQNKVNIRDNLPMYFDCELKLLTTACVIIEAEKFGRLLSGATAVVKQFGIHRCGHTREPLPASQCILSMLGEENAGRYIVATQDKELRHQARMVAGTPILFLFDKAPCLEGPSETSQKLVAQREKDKLRVSERDQRVLGSLKRKMLGEEEGEGSKRMPKSKRRRQEKWRWKQNRTSKKKN